MDELAAALIDFGALLWALLRATATAIGPAAWHVLVDYPKIRYALIAATALFILWWFIDGVRNWQRDCLRCKARGSFRSKLSKRLKRPCKSCGGAACHTTIRRRLFNRIRRRAT